MIESLRKTKPWVRLLSILGFITGAIMIVASLVMIGVGMVKLAKGGMEGSTLIAIGFVYLIFSSVYLLPSLYLFRYAGAIGSALSSSVKTSAVEQALRWQQSFWRFAGILSLVVLFLYVPVMIAAIAIPNMKAAAERAKQRQTMEDIRRIGAAIEARARDLREYPGVDAIGKLAPLLEPQYMENFPIRDAWGHYLFYAALHCSPGGRSCRQYVLASGGRDGRLEMQLPEYVATGPMLLENVDEAIVFSNGSFIHYPPGTAP